MTPLDAFRSPLADRFPQWSSWIMRVPLEEASGPLPADNDGQTVYCNNRLLKYYTEEHQSFFLAQQLLHLRLAHHARGRDRDPQVWKRATDAVVNRMLRDEGFSLPMDAVLLTGDEQRSAEELYDLLLAEKQKETKPKEQPPGRDGERTVKRIGKKAGKASDGGRREIEDPGLAAAVAGLSEMLEPSLQLDFDWFPGDTIRDGMLPWRFSPYPVAHTEILLDTSASVDTDLLRAFVRCVKALMREDAVIRVGCFDTRFYGFHDIHSEQDIEELELRGAGGTNFHVAVDAFTGDAENRIIFTDGYAEMPARRCDAVWVVYGTNPIHPPGGRVIYARPPEEKEKHEITFLIT